MSPKPVLTHGLPPLKAPNLDSSLHSLPPTFKDAQPTQEGRELPAASQGILALLDFSRLTAGPPPPQAVTK